MIRGQPVFDGIAIMELSCNFLHDIVALEAKAAFVQSEPSKGQPAGTTHGSTTCTRWSEPTMKKLAELREAMEQDLANRHFKDSGLTARGISPDDVGGIGENLQDEDGTNQL